MPIELLILARAQDGLVTRGQVLAAGVTVDAVRHALGRGERWQRVVTGIYATFTGALHERHLVRAALLHAGPDAMVTGSVACRAYGLRYVPSATRPTILVPEHVHRAPIAIAKIRRTRHLPCRAIFARSRVCRRRAPLLTLVLASTICVRSGQCSVRLFSVALPFRLNS